MGIEKSKVTEAISQTGLSQSVRPEQLSMKEFIDFSENLKKLL